MSLVLKICPKKIINMSSRTILYNIGNRKIYFVYRKKELESILLVVFFFVSGI